MESNNSYLVEQGVSPTRRVIRKRMLIWEIGTAGSVGITAVSGRSFLARSEVWGETSPLAQTEVSRRAGVIQMESNTKTIAKRPRSEVWGETSPLVQTEVTRRAGVIQMKGNTKTIAKRQMQTTMKKLFWRRISLTSVLGIFHDQF